MINKVRAWEAKIPRLTFRPRMKPDDTWWVAEQAQQNFLRKSWRMMGLQLLTEKIASKIWTSMTWAVYEGDVPRASWSMARDPYNVQRWKHKVWFHNRRVQWDTPMARWAGEGNDWKKLMAQRKPRKEDVIRSLLDSMKQAVEKEDRTQRDQADQEAKGPAPT